MGLQARIFWVVVLALAGAALVGLFLVQGERDVVASYRALQEGPVATAEETRRIQVLFKKQVQAWKDVLLRGADPADRARYTRELDGLDAEVDSAAAALPGLERFRADHRALGVRYREALAVFVASDGRATFEVDRMVRGIDRPPTDLLDAQVEAAHQAETAAEAEIAVALDRRTAWSLALTVCVLAAVVVAAVLLSRRIARPILAAEGLARRLAAGELVPDAGATGELGTALNDVLVTLGRQKRAAEALEEEVAERDDRIEAGARELAALSYIMAHDLRAPVRHIGAFTSKLGERLDRALDPEARRYLGIIDASVRRMGLLIDGLLELSRVGRQPLELAPTPLGALVADVIAALGAGAVDWRIGALPRVECDPALLRQALAEVIGNAVKFSRPRAPAVVEIDAAPDGTIRVRDNGVGFDPRYADKVFGVFERLHRGDQFEGVGIGLAIAHRIIERHGGRISATAVVDGGATFAIVLPTLTYP